MKSSHCAVTWSGEVSSAGKYFAYEWCSGLNVKKFRIRIFLDLQYLRIRSLYPFKFLLFAPRWALVCVVLWRHGVQCDVVLFPTSRIRAYPKVIQLRKQLATMETSRECKSVIYAYMFVCVFGWGADKICFLIVGKGSPCVSFCFQKQVWTLMSSLSLSCESCASHALCVLGALLMAVENLHMPQLV